MSRNGSNGAQIAIDVLNDAMWYRRMTATNTFGRHGQRVADSEGGYQVAAAPTSSDANNAVTNGWYNWTSTTTNTPFANGTFSNLTISSSAPLGVQLAFNNISDNVWFRRRTAVNTWQSWRQMATTENGYQTTVTNVADANTRRVTGFYALAATAANVPDPANFFHTIDLDQSDATTQRLFQIAGQVTGGQANCYVRYIQGTEVRGWNQIAFTNQLNSIAPFAANRVPITADITITTANLNTYNNMYLYVPTSVTTGTLNITIDYDVDLEGFWLFVYGNPTALNIVGGTESGTSNRVQINGQNEEDFTQYQGGRVEVEPSQTNNYGVIANVGMESQSNVTSLTSSFGKQNSTLTVTLDQTTGGQQVATAEIPSLQHKPIETSAALTNMSYDADNALGSGADVYYTGLGGGNVVFFNLIPTDDDEGTTWLVTNNSSNQGFLRLQLEEVSGTNKGRWIGVGDFSTDGRDVDIQHGETVMVTAFRRVAGGIHDFLFRSLGAVGEVQAGTNVTVTGTTRRPVINATATGTQLNGSVDGGAAETVDTINITGNGKAASITSGTLAFDVPDARVEAFRTYTETQGQVALDLAETGDYRRGCCYSLDWHNGWLNECRNILTSRHSRRLGQVA